MPFLVFLVFINHCQFHAPMNQAYLSLKRSEKKEEEERGKGGIGWQRPHTNFHKCFGRSHWVDPLLFSMKWIIIILTNCKRVLLLRVA